MSDQGKKFFQNKTPPILKEMGGVFYLINSISANIKSISAIDPAITILYIISLLFGGMMTFCVGDHYIAKHFKCVFRQLIGFIICLSIQIHFGKDPCSIPIWGIGHVGNRANAREKFITTIIFCCVFHHKLLFFNKAILLSHWDIQLCLYLAITLQDFDPGMDGISSML
jgi:hypothetical protein